MPSYNIVAPHRLSLSLAVAPSHRRRAPAVGPACAAHARRDSILNTGHGCSLAVGGAYTACGGPTEEASGDSAGPSDVPPQLPGHDKCLHHTAGCASSVADDPPVAAAPCRAARGACGDGGSEPRCDIVVVSEGAGERGDRPPCGATRRTQSASPSLRGLNSPHDDACMSSTTSLGTSASKSVPLSDGIRTGLAPADSSAADPVDTSSSGVGAAAGA
eukprot:scaffold20725_cov111-Isochrysis_galbana.AAC.11